MNRPGILVSGAALVFVTAALILARLNREEEELFEPASKSSQIVEPQWSNKPSVSVQTIVATQSTESRDEPQIESPVALNQVATNPVSSTASELPSCGQVLGDKPRDTSKDLPDVKHYELPGAESAVDKDACYAAAAEVRRARQLYDATPAITVSYNNVPPMMGSDVSRMVLGVICAGDKPFDPNEKFEIELFYVTAVKTTRVTIGRYWISEGTIRTSLTDEQYGKYVKTLERRRRDVIGPFGNMTRESFDQRMARGAFNLLAAQRDEGARRDLELRLAQRKLPTDCIAGDDLSDGYRRVP